MAGHQGHPDIVAELGRDGRRRRLTGKRGRGTLADEKPPILGLLQRDGEVVIRMLPPVQQVTIQPVLTHVIQPGSLLYTDAYDIYTRLKEWGYQHKTVHHAAGEDARDEDGDGFHEPWKAWGRCCALGDVRLAASRKKNCRCIWASLSLFTMPAVAVGRCWPRS